MAYHGTMNTTTTPTESHELAGLFQVPSGSPLRYPTHAGWRCVCGATGTVKAPWGTQTDASLAAHREHAADKLMVEPDSSGPLHECDTRLDGECSVCGDPVPDSAPVLIRATVTKPDGDTSVIFGGYVPAWLWDNHQTRELWKRDHRADVLAHFTARPRQARGYRVTWEAFDEVPQ
jgi:hypothetical protein